MLCMGGCPQDPLFVTTEDSSGGGTQSPTADTASDASTSGGDSTDADATTAADPTEGDTTTGAVVNCGHPAMECAITHREWCVDLGDLCGKTPLSPTPGNGGGTDYCAIVGSMCDTGTPPCQICNYAANTCKQLGGGESACNNALAECLCHAQAHDLPID